MPRLLCSVVQYAACSFVLLSVTHAQMSLSEADKQELLDAHNRLRGMVSPLATNMERMVSWAALLSGIKAPRFLLHALI